MSEKRNLMVEKNYSKSYKNRDQRKAFLDGEQVEGRQAVLELLKVAKRPVKELLIAEDYVRSGQLKHIYDRALVAGVLVKKVSKIELSHKAVTEAPQGVIAVAEPLEAVALAKLIKTSLITQPAPFMVLLDSVSDPYNVGSIIRTSLAAGAAGVILCEHGAANITPAAAKAAAGAIEHMPLARVSRAPAAIKLLKEKGFWSIGLDAHSGEYLNELPILAMPLVLVMGSEGQGISTLAKERCDVLAKIKMFGPVESLGVSAAAAVACFTVAQHRP